MMQRRISFIEKIEHKKNFCLCVGLDPRVEISEIGAQSSASIAKKIVEKNKKIIAATRDVCACYKPNIAFYECHGNAGFDALEETIELIPSSAAVILDAKRGDIGAVAEAYARGFFQRLRVDAVTLSPYMGKDSIIPFLKYEGAFVFIVVRTSNVSSDEVQMPRMENGGSVYEYIAAHAALWANADKLGFVVGATEPNILFELRQRYPDRIILAPGIGAQGADMAECIECGADAHGRKILPVVARGISDADDPYSAAREYHQQAERALKDISTKRVASMREQKSKLNQRTQIIDGLFLHSCVKIGSFTLKSGMQSPFYIDLRRIISFPTLFRQAIRAYADIAGGISFDCIAGIPTAALPFAAALSYEFGVPMIYPRIPKKAHGTGNDIEGAFEAGQTALLLDDLITKGTSKQEAVEILRGAGLAVHDLVVLIRRATQACSEMRLLDIRVHYVIDIDDVIARGAATGCIDEVGAANIASFLQN